MTTSPPAPSPPPPPAAPPSVSFVLVSWNRREDLLETLRSVRAQEPPDPTPDAPAPEVVVVDNGSADGTVESLRAGEGGPLTLYRAPRNLGAAVARNTGMRLARGEFVVFMDSDASFLESDATRVLVRRLRDDPSLAAVGPAIYADAGRREPWFLGGHYLRGRYCDLPRQRADASDPEYLSTCLSVWRAEVVRSLGGFDPALPYGFEDNDLSERAVRAGRGLAVETSRSVHHRLSPVARIRPESAGWSHFRYDDRARRLLQVRALGLLGFLREEAWQWSRAGRTQRHFIFLHAPLRRRWKWALHAIGPFESLLLHPLAGLRRPADWIARAPLDPARVERIAPSRIGDAV